MEKAQIELAKKTDVLINNAGINGGMPQEARTRIAKYATIGEDGPTGNSLLKNIILKQANVRGRMPIRYIVNL